jgi:hypothetical protein
MLFFKLLLIGATVYLSSLAARRGGHVLAGLVTGLPMILGPILGIVLLDHGPALTEKITWATIACFPATLLHALVFSHAAKRFQWPLSLLLASLAYLLAAAFLSWLDLPAWGMALLALAAPSTTLALMPSDSTDRAAEADTSQQNDPQTAAAKASLSVRIPVVEVFLRMGAAMSMAAAIIAGAGQLPAAVSGLLLAIPIAGAVLPCFTLPRYGYAATVHLLKGFARGLHGFCAFCLTLAWLLPATHPAVAFLLALSAAAGVGLALSSARR